MPEPGRTGLRGSNVTSRQTEAHLRSGPPGGWRTHGGGTKGERASGQATRSCPDGARGGVLTTRRAEDAHGLWDLLWGSFPQCKGRNLSPLNKTTVNTNKWPNEWVLSSNHPKSRYFQNRSPIRSHTSHVDGPKGKHFCPAPLPTHRWPGRQLFKAYSVSLKTGTLQRTSASEGCADAFPPTAGANQGNHLHTVTLPFSEAVADTVIKQEVSWWLRWWRIRLPCRRPRFDPCIRKIPWRRECLPTPVFSLGEFHRQRSLGRCSVYGVTNSQTWLSD